MKNTYVTARLHLQPMSVADAAFIYALVNTEGWIKYIGNRNVTSVEDADSYIRKILNNSNVTYWVVRSKNEQTPMGIITFIKREYLSYPDIGFAFLPLYSGKGYAYEAAKTILDEAITADGNLRVLATTVPDNTRSIQLLWQLGLRLEEEILHEGEKLLVYATPA